MLFFRNLFLFILSYPKAIVNSIYIKLRNKILIKLKFSFIHIIKPEM